MTPGRSEKLVVAAAEAGERLDRVLAARMTELSRSRHKALILAGRVAIDGATIRDPGHRVNAGGTIRLELPPAAEAAIAPPTSSVTAMRSSATAALMTRAPFGSSAVTSAGVLPSALKTR